MYPVLFHFGPIVIPAFGVMSALGVLVCLYLSQRTARTTGVDRSQLWNLTIVALFTALVVQRLLLLALNWNDILRHPRWLLALSMIHHPLLTAVGAFAGIVSAIIYARLYRMDVYASVDALAGPLTLGLACEQVGALLAGSGYGTPAEIRWAVVYTNPLAARWSGAPLGVPVHPVQAYAALFLATLALLLLFMLPTRRQPGDIAGACLLGLGIGIFFTEFWRDPEGRGWVLNGALNAPQISAIFFVILGGLALRSRRIVASSPTLPVSGPIIAEELSHE